MHEGEVSAVLGPGRAGPPWPRRPSSPATCCWPRTSAPGCTSATCPPPGSVEIVRLAKQRGLPVTAEVTPHHLLLTDEEVRSYDPVYKVNPPLRTAADVAGPARGRGRRHRRRGGHRPRPPPHRGQGLRVGRRRDGDDRPGDRAGGGAADPGRHRPDGLGAGGAERMSAAPARVGRLDDPALGWARTAVAWGSACPRTSRCTTRPSPGPSTRPRQQTAGRNSPFRGRPAARPGGGDVPARAPHGAGRRARSSATRRRAGSLVSRGWRASWCCWWSPLLFGLMWLGWRGRARRQGDVRAPAPRPARRSAPGAGARRPGRGGLRVHRPGGGLARPGRGARSRGARRRRPCRPGRPGSGSTARAPPTSSSPPPTSVAVRVETGSPASTRSARACWSSGGGRPASRPSSSTPVSAPASGPTSAVLAAALQPLVPGGTP